MRSRCSTKQPVAVAAVWREVFRSVLPDGVDTAVLVCPTWWPPSRVERVREAAAARSTNVVCAATGRGARRRCARRHDRRRDCAGVRASRRQADVVTADAASRRIRQTSPRTVADAVGPATAVLVDAPVGVDGAVALAGAISECLRSRRRCGDDGPPGPGAALQCREPPNAADSGHRAAATAMAEGRCAGRRRRHRWLCSVVGLAVRSDVNGPGDRCR